MVEITASARRLCWRCRRNRPGNTCEVEEVCHVGSVPVPLREIVGDPEPGFNEFYDRGVIHHFMRDVVLPGERRHYDQRYSITGIAECAQRIGHRAPRLPADITALQIFRQAAVRTGDGLGRNMVEKSA